MTTIYFGHNANFSNFGGGYPLSEVIGSTDTVSFSPTEWIVQGGFNDVYTAVYRPPEGQTFSPPGEDGIPGGIVGEIEVRLGGEFFALIPDIAGLGLAPADVSMSALLAGETTLIGDGSNHLDGTSDNDTIRNASELRGFEGDDTLDGGPGFSTVSYGSDLAGVVVNLAQGWALDGSGGVDTLISIEGVRGSLQEDVLIGSAHDDTLDGGGGADWIVGGEGDDRFLQTYVLEGYVDRIFGGFNGADSGFDTLDYSGALTDFGVIIQLSGYVTTSGGALLATFSGIEAAVGTDHDDALIGNALGNVLTGDAGADWIVGGAGDDTFVQGMETGSPDRLFGDAGTDTIDYSGAASGVTVQLNGWSTVIGGATLATFTNIENAVGSAFSDALIGSALDNRIAGGAGADWLVGGAGNDIFVQGVEAGGVDRIFGDAGTDALDYSGAGAGVVVQLSGYSASGGATLATFTGVESAIGSAFSDALIGNASDNHITGGAGGDWLVGGAGADTFIYRATSDDAGDSIRDFAQGADKIDFSAIDANPGAAGDDAFAFATTRHAGVLGEAVVTNSGGFSLVSLYLDADNIADMTIQVVHGQGVVMNAGDFVL